jgi:hypothetical protein
MSEIRHSGKSFQSKSLPVLIMITGLVLLWFGNQEYQLFQAEVESYVSARPDNRTLWLIILGTAASIAGALGLIRDRIF